MDLEQVRLAGADWAGLTLISRNRHWFEPWDAVDGILLARVPWGDITALAAAIGIGGGERCVLAFEAQAEWKDLIGSATAILPGIVAEDQWEAKLAAVNQCLYIYERPPSARASLH